MKIIIIFLQRSSIGHRNGSVDLKWVASLAPLTPKKQPQWDGSHRLYAATLTLKMAPHGLLSLSWEVLLLQYTVAWEILMRLFTSFGVMQTASACFSPSQCSSHQANIFWVLHGWIFNIAKLFTIPFVLKWTGVKRSINTPYLWVKTSCPTNGVYLTVMLWCNWLSISLLYLPLF